MTGKKKKSAMPYYELTNMMQNKESKTFLEHLLLSMAVFILQTYNASEQLWANIF